MAITDVLTLAQAKAVLAISPPDTTDDVIVTACVTAISRQMDDLVGPVVNRTITNEAHTGGSSIIWVNNWPVSTFTAVREWNGTTYPALVTGVDYIPDLYKGQGTFSGLLWRVRNAQTPIAFSTGLVAVQVDYVAGRYATTALVDGLFAQAAAIILANWYGLYRATTDVQHGEFVAPGAAFPRFGLPKAAKELLRGEWQGLNVG